MQQLIRKEMPVLGSDGGHVGTVDALVPGGRIRLTREDDPAHNHGYRHLPLHLVAQVEAGQVRLTVPAQDAKAIAFGALSAGDEDDPQSAAGLGQVNNPGVGASVSWGDRHGATMPSRSRRAAPCRGTRRANRSDEARCSASASRAAPVRDLSPPLFTARAEAG